MPTVVDLRAADCFSQVADSLMKSGFATVSHAPVSLQQLADFYAAWDDFFANGNPHDFTADPQTQAGYFSPDDAETARGAVAQDLKEYFQHWPWSPLPPTLRSLTQAYYESIFQLAGQILEGLQANSHASLWQRLTMPLSDCLSRSETMLRILRYPPLQGDEPENAIRAGAHEDINLITLLPVANTPGLEIRPDGEDWQAIDAPRGSIIVNIGDMLQELTQGALPSTPHRVVNPTGHDRSIARITAPLFCHPYSDMVLSDRYTAGRYLRERLQEINPANLRPV